MGIDFIFRSRLLLFLIFNTCVHQLNSLQIATFYSVMSVSNSTDVSSATRTFEQIRTTIECSAKCSEFASMAFYFIKRSSTCHCNDHQNPTLVPSNAPGNIRYGYIVGNVTSTTTPTSTTTTTTPEATTPGTTTVYCDTQANGWTVFQRRLDGSLDFFRGWTEYVNGFGDPDGEYWLGLETIHQMTVGGGCDLCVYLEAGPNNLTTQESGYAMYSSFMVDSALKDYRLLISGFSGNVGDSLTEFHNASAFSTYDMVNDASGYDCATDCKGAWWYNECHTANLNGLYLGGENNDYGDSMIWELPWGYYFSLLKTEMAFRCV